MKLVTWRSWLAIFVIGLALHFGWCALVDLKQGHAPVETDAGTHFSYESATAGPDDAARHEEAELLDSAPLFMPTAWNYASSYDDVANLKRAAEPYRMMGPELLLADPAQTAPSRPALVARDSLWDETAPSSAQRLQSIGQESRQTIVLPPRAPRVEVTDLESGRVVYTGDLPETYAQEATGEWWNPYEALLLVSPSGRWGRPFRTAPTGITAFDDALHRYLQSENFLRNLPVGYFRIAIAP
ncbi:MAG: hypothetical protein E1N59_2466 [Puniceicoccaceae bacterium 5H]|nr:MAG: hypothetical protein E1N59_2466 [Puniceicoccaceae bacterium 5H]